MPAGSPSAKQLWEGEVSFFSLDTDLIQAAGYNFEKGALHQLPKQLPRSMSLQLSEVVFREILKHRMEPVIEALRNFTSSSGKLRRLTGLDLSSVDKAFTELDAEKRSDELFRRQVQDYAARCRGGVLELTGVDSRELFQRYFATQAPFGTRADKKSEFPDAASLLMLEKFARDNGTKGVLASGDAGWAAFAEQSEHLYCVKSIEELAGLFAATDVHAEGIKARIVEAVGDERSALRAKLEQALKDHVASASWDTSELYSGSVQRIEPEVYDAELVNYSLRDQAARVWPVEGDAKTWVVELSASVSVTVYVSVSFYVWDSIDKEEVAIGSRQYRFAEEIDVDAYLTCSDVQLDTPPRQWDIDIDIAEGAYSAEGGEVEPDFGGEE